MRLEDQKYTLHLLIISVTKNLSYFLLFIYHFLNFEKLILLEVLGFLMLSKYYLNGGIQVEFNPVQSISFLAPNQQQYCYQSLRNTPHIPLISLSLSLLCLFKYARN